MQDAKLLKGPFVIDKQSSRKILKGKQSSRIQASQPSDFGGWSRDQIGHVIKRLKIEVQWTGAVL